MDKQLGEVLAVFNGAGLCYWLDSGTLLGLMRDGRLLENDGDLDISLWEEEEEKLKAVLPRFRQMGYRIYTASYSGRVFKYNLTPARRGLRTVDINIYRQSATHAWCPMYYFRLRAAQRKRRRGKKKQLGGFLYRFLRAAWKCLNRRFAVHVSVDRLPWRLFLQIGTWWIPKDLYAGRVYLPGLQACVPEKWEEYLAFRYGDWQVPRADWVFYADDRGIRQAAPEELIRK